MTRRLLPLLLVLLSAAPALGHALGRTTLQLDRTAEGLRASWAIAARDLDAVLAIDRNGDGAVSPPELEASRARVLAYALDRLELSADGRACRVDTPSARLDGANVTLAFEARCASLADTLTLRYELFFEHDPSHEGFVRLSEPTRTRSLVTSAGTRQHVLTLTESSSAMRELRQYVVEGIHHIWIGIDHILFLIALLLPAVRTRSAGEPSTPVRLRTGLRAVVTLVTAFTLAHSLTLTLAALEIVQLPERLVESAIALSIIVAALDNVWPVFAPRRRVAVAFGFGLLHGFGFANVLGELGLPRALYVPALLGFNLGVEIGQLAIVLVVFPFLFVLRDTRFYERVALRYTSLAVSVVAAVWLYERALDQPLITPVVRALTGDAQRIAGADEQRRLGEQALARGDHERARKHYETAARDYARADDRASQADMLLRAGDADLTVPNLASARARYDEALTIREQLGDARGQAALYRQLALTTRLGGDRQGSASMLRRALAIAERLESEADAARDSAALGALYRELNQLEDAQRALERAVAITEASDDRLALAEHIGRLAVVLQLRGAADQAQKQHERALALHEALGHEREAADTHANLGMLAKERGDVAAARRHWARALASFERLGEHDKARRLSTALAAARDEPSATTSTR